MPRLRPAIPAEEKALNAPSKFKISGPDLMDGGTCPASDVNYSVGSREGVVKWNSYCDAESAPYRYSRTGRFRFVSKEVMEDRFPLDPAFHSFFTQCLYFLIDLFTQLVNGSQIDVAVFS